MKPILKWAGGKTGLLPELRKHLPAEFNGYYEPFFGGGALLFDLERTLGPVVAGDMNKDLIKTYETLKYGFAHVGFALDELANNHEKYGAGTYYLNMRAEWNDGAIGWGDAERAALFIYLNKTCFNGIWRVNRKGKFNVPRGDANLSLPSREDLEAAGRYLQNVTLLVSDFAATVRDVKAGDVVYFDPPYIPQPGTASFTTYSKADFKLDDHKALCSTFAALQGRGATCILSNSDTPLTREVYAGFKFHEVTRKGTMSSKGEGRQRVGEVIITGWP